jgi:hypothetical protein
VEDVASADRVARDHRDNRLRQSAHLDLEVGHVKPAHRGTFGEVAGVAPDPLVSAGAECVLSLPCQDHDANLRVLASQLERRGELDQCLRAKGVVDLRPVDRDLRDAVGLLVEEVAVVRRGLP